MAKQEINITNLPAGLSKDDFIELPELKSVKSWFTWAGIVGIVSGVLGFAAFGQVAEYEAQGYVVDMRFYGAFAALSVVSLVLGIRLLMKKTNSRAYALAAVGVIMAVAAVASGGSIGVGFIATILSVIGARKIDKLWNEYQAAGRHL